MQLRVNEARAARQLCRDHGYSCLVVPRVVQHGGFVIATQLPNPSDYKESIGTYLEEPDVFNTAVAQLTRFLYHAALADLVGIPTHPYSSRCTTPLGRYDNLLLFVDDGVGYIGLVDVEGFQARVCPSAIYPQVCLDLVRLFPCHVTVILEAAQTVFPGIEPHRERLTQEAAAALTGLHGIYTTHLAFLERRGITPADPIALSAISPAQMEALKQDVTRAVSAAFADPESPLCQRGIEASVVTTPLHTSFPAVLHTVLAFLSDRLQQQLRRIPPKFPLSSFPEFTSRRTVYWEIAFSTTATSSNSPYKQCLFPLYELLDLKNKIKKNSFLHMQITILLVQTIFSSLVAVDVIADYTPCTGGSTEHHLKECCAI